MNYKITAVDGPREWTGQYGTNHSFDLRLEGVDKPVEFNQKAGKPHPVVGDQIALTLEAHPRFENKLKGKREQQGFGGGGPRPEDPARARAILRQHSQHMTLLYIGTLPEDKRPRSWGEFWGLVDRFDADVNDVREGRRRDVQRTGLSDVPNDLPGAA